MSNSPSSEELFERARKKIPGGVHSPVRAFKGVGGVPRFIRSAKKARIEDVEGKSYVDFCMAWGPLIFGHQDEETSEAVRAALSRGWSFGAAEPYSLDLAELITESIPWVQKIRFVNSGTEAVMSALRVARAATGRNKILKFEGCYHGHADSMLVRAGSGLAEMASPDSAGVTKKVASETLVVPLDNLTAVEQMFLAHGRDIAAVIIEPVPANNGLLIQTDEFLKKVAQLAKKAGALLIFDEVITGFRVAWGGMAERTGIKPDLVTYGKVIGGGFPVGAYGGRQDLMDWVAPVGPVYQAGTLSANPVAMSAGLATLRKLKKENPYEKLAAATEKLSKSLRERAEAGGISLKVQSFASMFWMIFGDLNTKDGVCRAIDQIPSTQKDRYPTVFHSLLNQGIYIAPSGFEVSFLSTAHQQQDIDLFLAAFEHSIRAVNSQTLGRDR